MSEEITGEELKERLIKHYKDLVAANNRLQKWIQEVKDIKLYISEEEKLEIIKHSEESMRQNDWLCSVLKDQLKRDFDYEI